MTEADIAVASGSDAFWTTESFEGRSKMAEWTDIVSKHMAEMAVSSDTPERYHAVWRQYRLGAIDLNFLSSSAQEVHRTPQMVSRDGGSSFELIYLKRGSMVVHSPLGARHYQAGDFALLRNAEPYDFTCPQPSAGLLLHFDLDWCRRWLPDGFNMDNLSPDQRRAWGGPLAALLMAIDKRGIGEIPLPRHMIADQIGALLSLMAGDRMPSLGRHKEVMLRRSRALMRDMCNDPGLDPQALANAMGISKRSLHSLFAGARTSFSQVLLAIRLDLAARLLCEGAGRSVGEIAYEVGFNDTSHFAKRFRARFGHNPSTYRKMSAGLPSP